LVDMVGPQFGFHDHRQRGLHPIRKRAAAHGKS
jgi:hypothetical protein